MRKAAYVWVAIICSSMSSCMVAPRIDPPVAPPASVRDEVRAFAELVNEYRQSKGCKPLTWVSAVAAVAQQHSQNMVHYGFFSHTDHEGQDPFERLGAAGILFRSAAENIAYGQRTAEQVLQSWLSSSGHRRNIEDCGFAQHGIGLVGTRWTHVFVTMR